LLTFVDARDDVVPANLRALKPYRAPGWSYSAGGLKLLAIIYIPHARRSCLCWLWTALLLWRCMRRCEICFIFVVVRLIRYTWSLQKIEDPSQLGRVIRENTVWACIDLSVFFNWWCIFYAAWCM